MHMHDLGYGHTRACLHTCVHACAIVPLLCSFCDLVFEYRFESMRAYLFAYIHATAVCVFLCKHTHRDVCVYMYSCMHIYGIDMHIIHHRKSVNMCLHMSVCRHAYISSEILPYIHTHMCSHMSIACSDIRTSTRMCTTCFSYTHVCVCVFGSAYTRMLLASIPLFLLTIRSAMFYYMLVCMYVCVCVNRHAYFFLIHGYLYVCI